MKKALYIFVSAALLLFAASCAKEDHAVNQKVTYYPVFEVAGGATYAHQVGTPWVDPGITATIQGEDITDKLDIDDNVDGDESGVYTVTYSYTNEDGFTNSITRTVVVYDIANAGTADISGTYSDTRCEYYKYADDSYVNSYNDRYGFAYSQEITGGPATGLFYLQDLLCGLYEYYAGYGSRYAFKAFILLGSDNSISLLNGDEIDPWGDPITLLDGEYDPATGSITLVWDWLSTNYYVTIYKP